ncbi:MAG: RdgB/HAM1 family non-canonical purine NTP pyrophosphatase [Bacteroidia bacterium]|nr:RdgB/HAM1 family non-canonical purine NTP pyrophosphatase [Bacteroidota bacterium]MBP9082420.1 RdgB/HAM1 family non-canonical purine NTP pyrophosphatase [Bacteroidia bacterium]
MNFKLVVASGNSSKLTEIRQMMPQSFEIVSMKELGFTGDIPETADTFAGNALLKARFISNKFMVNSLADDSGLEVEALSGRPGVYSARFAGPGSSAQQNIDRLMAEMEGVINRKARFVAVLALVLEGQEFLFEGFVNGTISQQQAGNSGFGYDPVFIPEGYSQTFAMLSPDLKNRLSHRRMAIDKLVAFLNQRF